MLKVDRVIDTDKRLACITLDIERDYGDRTGELNILEKEQGLHDLSELFNKKMAIPVSAFIVTELLINHPKSFEIIKLLAKDYHSHSHTHDTKLFDAKKELNTSSRIFEEYFGHKPIGYRAPLGIISETDIRILKKCGYKFSSSVFPTFRPGVFNNLSSPRYPHAYPNGILELPLSVLPGIRVILSMSYLKFRTPDFA